MAPRKRKRTAPSTYLEDDFEFFPPTCDEKKSTTKEASKEKSAKKSRESRKKTSQKNKSEVLQISNADINIKCQQTEENGTKLVELCIF